MDKRDAEEMLVRLCCAVLPPVVVFWCKRGGRGDDGMSVQHNIVGVRTHQGQARRTHSQ